MRYSLLMSLFCLFVAGFASHTRAADSHELEISFTLPRLAVSPYHRPYVVIWVESAERHYISTIALWADDAEWHKDLRQWWRKVGRQTPDFDAVTSATRKPGPYKITWQGKLADGSSLAPGKYLLNVEVSREEGGRSYFRQPFTWSGDKASFALHDKGELHDLVITQNNS